MSGRLGSRGLIVVFLFLVGASLALCAEGERSPADASQWTRPYKANPAYWQYKGMPVLLVGGSKDDSLFQIPDLKEHLDLLASVGGNCIRNTMSSRPDHDFEVYRFKRLESGKYYLDQWNPEYWTRFENMLRLTNERDIIVQIEVWDRFDYSQQNWQVSPWRPANNVNYTTADSGLANNYPAPAYRDRQPFFHSIPGMPLYSKSLDTVRRYQERYLDKMLSHSLRYGNVLYCMNNETSTPPEWGQYWMKYIRDKGAAADVEVFVTDMFDDGWAPQKSAKIRQAFNKPDLYAFIDVSQVNSRTFNEGHWNNIFWLAQQNRKNPRPLNCTKIYSDGETTWGSGTPVDGVERFWRNLIAGTASCRFHRPGAGIGLNETAQACIRAARKVESRARFWDVEPHMELLSDRAEDEAYLAANPGNAYILFFTDGGAVTLDLSKAEGKLTLQWVNITTGEWGAKTTIEGGKPTPIAAPSKGPWVATIIKD